MLYERYREMAGLTTQHWITEEVFTFQWFVLVGVVITFYVVWLCLLNRSRAKDLLLIGSLAAVFFAVNSFLLIEFLGLADYHVRIVPIYPPVFATSVTVSPIIIMLVQQYTSTWKGYLLWSAIGYAFLNFVIFPVFTSIDLLELHKNWNWFYHFLALFGVAQFTRLVYLWIAGVQKRHEAK